MDEIFLWGYVTGEQEQGRAVTKRKADIPGFHTKGRGKALQSDWKDCSVLVISKFTYSFTESLNSNQGCQMGWKGAIQQSHSHTRLSITWLLEHGSNFNRSLHANAALSEDISKYVY